MGSAYAFFDCGASKEEIEEELPFIRDAVRTPGDLELSLTEGIGNLNSDGNLLELAKAEDRKYTLVANYHSGTNGKTADELADILNQAYQSPFTHDGRFEGKIVHGDWGKYSLRE